MKKIIFIFFILVIPFLFLTVLSGCGKSEEPKESGEVSMVESQDEKGLPYKEGEVLLKFKEDIDKSEHEKIISEYNCSVMSKIQGLSVYRLKIPSDKNVLEMIEIFNKDERVKYVEPNMIYRIQ